MSNLTIKEIKTYPSNLVIVCNELEERSTHKIVEINYDGQQGLYTEQEWREDELSEFSSEAQQDILLRLSNTSNVEFFAKDHNE